MNEWFSKFARGASQVTGSASAFMVATLVIIIWAVTGPIFHYSDTWQLVINTGTTIVTFLMVFLIQNAQNRDAKAFHLKIDELIRSSAKARNQMIDLERLSDVQLQRLQEEFNKICDDEDDTSILREAAARADDQAEKDITEKKQAA